jgi:hypothetical protein
MGLNIGKEVAAMQRMTVKELQDQKRGQGRMALI